jgi:hypothetical protein
MTLIGSVLYLTNHFLFSKISLYASLKLRYVAPNHRALYNLNKNESGSLIFSP